MQGFFSKKKYITLGEKENLKKTDSDTALKDSDTELEELDIDPGVSYQNSGKYISSEDNIKEVNLESRVIPLDFSQPPSFFLKVLHEIEYQWIYASPLRYFLDFCLNVRNNSSSDLDSQRKRAWFSYYFFQGFNNGLFVMLPLLVGTLTLHDVIEYNVHPENRFDASLLDIFLGRANNQVSWGSLWGSDLVTWWSCWLGITGALTIPLFSASLSLFLNRHLKKLDNNANFSYDYFSKRSLFLKPFSEMRWLIINNNVLLTRGLNMIDNLIVDIVQRTDLKPSFFKMIPLLRRMQTLTLLAADLKYYGIGKLKIAESDRLQDQQEERLFTNYLEKYKSCQEKLIACLVYVADFSTNPFLKLMSHYYLWSLGQSRRFHWDLFFIGNQIVLDAMIWFSIYGISYYHVAYPFYKKLYDLRDYYQRKDDCHAKDKDYVYIEEYGNYHCSACPDSDYVYYLDSDSFENCLNGLLSYSNDTHEIIQQSKKFFAKTNAQEIDLSKQAWSYWTYAEFNQFLSNVQRATNASSLLKISQPNILPFPPEQNKMSRLNEVLKQISFTRLESANLNLGSEYFTTLLQNINNTELTYYLDFSGNGLNDDDLSLVLEGYSHLQSFIFTHNVLSNYGLSKLADYLKNSSYLQVASVAYNQFSENGFYDLVRAVALSNAIELDVSGNDLSEIDFTEIFADLKASQLQSFTLNDCRINDQQFQVLAQCLPATLKKLSIENNYLDSNGLNALAIGFNSTQIEEFYAAYNQFYDDGLLWFSQGISSNSTLQLMDISYNSISVNGFISFIENFPESLTKFTAQGLAIGDAGASAIADLIQGVYGDSRLAEIDLSSNLITGKGASDIFLALDGQLTVTRLVLRQNYVDSDALRVLNAQDYISLLHCDLSDNPIGSNALSQFFAKLPDSNLQKLVLDDIPMNGTAFHGLQDVLITGTDQKDTLGHAKISIDEARALNNKAKPRTNLTEVSLQNTGITNSYARFFCHSIGPARINKTQFNMNKNPGITDINQDSCQISAAPQSGRAPQALLPLMVITGVELMPIFFSLIMLYVLYRGVRSLFNNENKKEEDKHVMDKIVCKP